jgi:hypothetical protein
VAGERSDARRLADFHELTMPLTVLAIADTPEQTAAVLRDLRQCRYVSDDVSLVYLSHAQRSDAAGEALPLAAPTVSDPLAALTSPTVNLPPGAVGDAYHWLPNLAAVNLPGVGMVVAAGSLRLALSNSLMTNLSAVTETASLQHALAELGIPVAEAQRYEERILAGGILIAAHAADAAAVDELSQLFHDQRARDVTCAVRPPAVTTAK